MENNVVNFEEEYFKLKNKEAYEKLMNREFEATREMLQEPIEKIEEKMKSGKKYCPQNVFDAAIFMNFLEPKATQQDFAKSNYYDFYLMRGAASYNLNDFEDSKKHYKKAIELNPASAVARLQMFEINKLEKQFDTYVEDIKDFFKYAYRRVDMARAYRDMGYYLCEIKDYEMAIVAYYLSNIYEVTDLAIAEVKHIAEIAKIDLDSKLWLSEEMMGEFYEKYKIPLLPNQDLVKLACAIADDSYSKKALKTALFTYSVAYELTLEEKYLDKVKELIKFDKTN